LLRKVYIDCVKYRKWLCGLVPVPVIPVGAAHPTTDNEEYFKSEKSETQKSRS
jgi:hypothetical protein